MKNALIVLLTLLSVSLNAQSVIPTLEKNPNWKKYNSVTVKTKGYKSFSKSEYTLKEGRIDSYKILRKEDFRLALNPVYDQYDNITYLISTGQKDKIDTIHINPKYNNDGLMTEDKWSLYTYNQNKQVVKKTSHKFKESIGKEGYSYSYQYDDNGNIARTEHTYFIKNNKQIDIEEFTYDQCGNVLTIDRSSSPEKKYPIIMIGGRALDQHETFEYEYNVDCLWTKKFLVKKDKRILLAEREIN